MHKKSSRAIIILVVLLMVLFSMSSCSNDKSGEMESDAPAKDSQTEAPVKEETGGEEAGLSTVGQFPITQTQQSFSIMMPPWGNTDPATSWVNEEYEKMTNVKIEWMTVPWDGWKEKRAIVFASGDLPDVVAGMDTQNLSANEELQYASQGLIIGLNDIIESNSVFLKQYMDEQPMIKKLISQDDGEIYSLPGLAVCFHCNYSQKMFINQTWLDNLGLASPTTIDEYYNVLKAFKEQDANGNGDPDDEIPLISCTGGWHVDLDGFLMCAFTYSDPDSKMAVEDGKLVFTPVTDGYKEGLEFLHKLYTEGLLSPESFTNDEPTNTKMNVANGDYAVIGSYPYAYQNYSGDTDMWKQYEILAPLKGADGFVTTPNYELTRNVIRGNFAITKDAENPDLIMHWVDWFYSNEGTMFRLGREGVEWRKADTGELDFNGNQAVYSLLSTPEDDPYYENIDFTQNIPVNYSKQYRESAVAAQDWRSDEIANGTEIQLFQGTIAYEAVARAVEDSIPALTVAEENISDYSRIQTEIFDYCETTLVKFITGDLDLEKDWETYKEQLNKYGLQDFLDMSIEAYANFKNR